MNGRSESEPIPEILKPTFVVNTLKCLPLPKRGTYHRIPQAGVIRKRLRWPLCTSPILYMREDCKGQTPSILSLRSFTFFCIAHCCTSQGSSWTCGGRKTSSASPLPFLALGTHDDCLQKGWSTLISAGCGWAAGNRYLANPPMRYLLSFYYGLRVKFHTKKQLQGLCNDEAAEDARWTDFQSLDFGVKS